MSYRLNLETGPVEVEGLDVDVWYAEDFEGLPPHVHVTIYPMWRNKNDLWDTDTGTVLHSEATDWPVEEWGESDWFGISDDNAPGEMPGQVLDLVNRFLREKGAA